MLISSQRKKQIGDLSARASPENILLVGDAAEVSLLPSIPRRWRHAREQRVILTPGVRAPKRWNWGTVDPATGRTVHVIHRRRNNVGFRRLLAAMSRAFDVPGHPERKVSVFVDNDKAHDAKPVRELLEKHGH